LGSSSQTAVISLLPPPALVVLNESSTVQANPLRIGLNNSTATQYDSGQFCKNWLCTYNPSFQGVIASQVVPITAGTTTTFAGYNVSDEAPANVWTGASYSGMVSPSNSGFQNVSGTITSNTVASGPATPVVYTIGSAAKAAAKGDYARILLQIDSSPGGTCNPGVASIRTCTPGRGSVLSGEATVGAQSTDLDGWSTRYAFRSAIAVPFVVAGLASSLSAQTQMASVVL
jgi:hypothetical protein